MNVEPFNEDPLAIVFAFSLSDSLWEPQTRRLVVDMHTARQL